jgi:putative transposase
MFKGRHFDRSVILLCVRWCLAYGLSLRNLEEMMAERGISVDHATIHRWNLHYSPDLLERFNRRKRPVTGKWHIDETYIKVRASGGISIAQSTAMVTPSSSGSASVAIWPLPSGS